MQTFFNLFRTDMKRAVLSRSFLLTIILMLLVQCLSSGDPFLRIDDYSVTEIIDNLFAGTGSVGLLLMLFPLLPYALSYARDEEENAVTFWMIRISAGKYLTSRFMAACISAFLSVVLSFIMLILLLLAMGHSLYNPELFYLEMGYAQLLAAGQPIAYFIAYLCDRGLSAAMMSGCAVWISTVYPNQYLSFSGPICIYFLVLCIFPRFDISARHLAVSSWVDGTYDSPLGGWFSLLCKLGVTLLVCGVYYLFSRMNVKRRWHYA